MLCDIVLMIFNGFTIYFYDAGLQGKIPNDIRD